MKNQKKFFFSNNNLKDLKMSEKQMEKIFGGVADLSDGTHTKTINYDRFTTYTESTYVRR